MVVLQQNDILQHGRFDPTGTDVQSNPIEWCLWGPGMMILFHRNSSLYWDVERAHFDQHVCRYSSGKGVFSLQLPYFHHSSWCNAN